MSSDPIRSRLEASKGALKAIYYVVVGIALTEAMDRVFLLNGAFQPSRLLESAGIRSVLLLFAFMLTISRFVHGASIHLDDIETGRFKALFDFIGFFAQASLFYVMALTISDPPTFVALFVLMLVADAAWLSVLCQVRYLTFQGTARQWVISDLLLMLALLATLYRDPVVSLPAAGATAIAAGTAAVIDYWKNWEFYFPAGQRAGVTERADSQQS